ncbi:class I SAM-dependent methyltransferase [Actinomadura rugatobispora]|uniref:Class I SAM-dependent methyltransferase n=1 Tax=Actinomadura rugatobispora TaxID=1994 RepID=A0ABW1A2I0_9ACTN|nr:trans-aconitate methyltransferase [Actinomadura rugatobispora]
MNLPDAARFTPDWLALREPADAGARAAELLAPLRAHLARTAAAAPLVVRDLGCGTGAQARWLAGRLPFPQRWILHDRDPGLLARARASLPPSLPAEAREGDVTALTAADLAGTTSLVTASALLDLLTFDEVDDLAAAVTGAGCPALLTLSVVGRVTLHPYDPLDTVITAAFNDHQRRSTGGRRLLGPDAVTAAAGAFGRRGATVRTGPSPWRLGPGQAALAAEWLRGWVAAACEQEPDLPGEEYLRRRLDACAAGNLSVVVHHRDLLALPASGGGEAS